jgi:hypothetical protein
MLGLLIAKLIDSGAIISGSGLGMTNFAISIMTLDKFVDKSLDSDPETKEFPEIKILFIINKERKTTRNCLSLL